MANSLKGFSPARPHGHRSHSNHLPNHAPHFPDAAEEPEKTMMPSIRKCYIVLRATAMWRKGAL
jgi:hypothetical protein